jgi:ABC-2 type transport system permease protein
MQALQSEENRGIDGWLLVPAAGLALLPIVLLMGIFASFSRIPTSDSPLLEWVWLVDLFVCLGLGLVAAYYFFSERQGAEVAVLALLIASAALGGVVLLLAIFTAGITAILLFAAGPVCSAAAAVGWKLYCRRSERAKATFTRPMTKFCALARRELTAYFVSPIAYVIGAGFLLLSAGWFFVNLRPGEEASLRPLFDGMAVLMVLAVPLLTMGLLSKEYDSGTIETLMTSPVTETEVIVGKFFGIMVFYLAMLAATVLFLGLIQAFGQPDFGVAASGYLGMIILGAAYVAVGIFASTLTRHQIVAAIVAMGILAFFILFMGFVVRLGISPWAQLADKLNGMRYFRQFSRGVFDSRGLFYFLTATGLFLFLSVKTLESRRWR